MATKTRLSAALWVGAMVVLTAAACGRTPFGIGPDEGTGGFGLDGPGGGLVDDDGPGPGGQGPGGQGAGGQGPGGSGAGGGPEVCVIDADCDDGDFCTTDACNDGTCEFFSKDSDDDGFIDVVCDGGTDCNDLNPNTHPGAPEICTDADDNDCNGVADCNDPACDFAPVCGCTPDPGGENCTNGIDDDCDTTVDCNDADCIGTPACGCLPTEAGNCENGIDDDCDLLTDCDDSDCAGSVACNCQATQEICNNDSDDDCDLLEDCADPDCAATPFCACVPPGSPELCSDDFDNDCDGLVDCADGNCAAAPACQMCMPEICDDGIDNDCDDIVDCADDACNFAPNCAPTQELCNNDLDDDNDGLTDCDDPDCSNNPLCVLQQSNCLTAKLIPGTGTYTGDTTGNEGKFIGACGGGAGEAVFYFTLTQPSFVSLDSIGTSFDSVLYVKFGDCDTGAEIACDDDSGGFQWSAKIEFPILYPGTYFVFLDGFTIDPQLGANEGPFTLNVQIIENPSEICGDGIDNDGDVYVDCADPDCENVGSCVNCNGGLPPTPELGTGACTDGQDNDCDGLPDCIDPDCSASPYAITECCNGMDQNDNGIPDDFSCRCASDNDCDPGQICYDSTVRTCGFPCQNFFGMVCPAVAVGSTCSPVSQQCEF